MSKDDWVYFAGVDVARGGHDAAQKISTNSKHTGDDFTIATWRWKEGSSAQLVHVFRQSGMELGQMSYVVHQQNRCFPYVFIMLDPGGGGVFLYDELRKPTQTDGQDVIRVTPMVTAGDQRLAGIGTACVVFFKRGEPRLDAIGQKFPAESHLINKAHDVFRTGLRTKEIQFPESWPGWGQAGASFANADQMRKWLNKRDGLEAYDRAWAEIDLAALQLIQIEREIDNEGKPAQDKYGNFTFMSKRKKDSAYAVIYGYFAVWVYQRTMDLFKQAEEAQGDVIVVSEDI